MRGSSSYFAGGVLCSLNCWSTKIVTGRRSWSLRATTRRFCHCVLACWVWFGMSVWIPVHAQKHVCVIANSSPATEQAYRVLHVYPHDPEAFTQGLDVQGNTLYEGTGLYGKSTLRLVDLETGAVLKAHRLPEQFFGEGITVPGDRIIQLTWKSRRGFIYDKSSFALLHTFEYPTQGWGITHNGSELIMSDGSAVLYFLDAANLERTRTVTVCDAGRPVRGLNELEWVDGNILANVYGLPRIAIIEPKSGRVDAWIDLSELVRQNHGTGVLNGIAYEAREQRLFVTGKNWPRLYELELYAPGD